MAAATRFTTPVSFPTTFYHSTGVSDFFKKLLEALAGSSSRAVAFYPNRTGDRSIARLEETLLVENSSH